MEMTDETLRTRLRGVADEIRSEDPCIVKRPTILLNDNSLIGNEYSRKIGTPFKQQKLAAWQPILTASTMIPWLLAIGILFLPVGIILLNTSQGIHEEIIEYTYCNDTTNQMRTCAEVIENDWHASCKCSKELVLDEPIDKDVFFYYALANFYQNHRRYVRSRNDWQLLGYTDFESLASCTPFERAQDPITGENKLIAPCGAIANSIFNDTFKLWYEIPSQKAIGTTEPELVTLLENEISWPTDRKSKFRNPSDLNELKKFTRPKNWQKDLIDFKSGNSSAFENEHLIVWMRSAALPKFRKLYARVDHSIERFKSGLPKGKYIIEIDYNFPVTQFGGKKSIILSNTSWLGGKNSFLGYAYIITGIVCLLITISLFFIYKKFGVRERDMLKVDPNTPFVYSNMDKSS